MHGIADVLPANFVGATPQFREPLRIRFAEPAENFCFVRTSFQNRFSQFVARIVEASARS
jgi:hypothetical protein